jgi:prepilin-type N-terminal cleavage/methylation domain-containing protein
MRSRLAGGAEGRARQGFTLMELILVMALLSGVIALSAPRLASFFQGRQLGSEAKRFLALTRHGQSVAISAGIPMVLWVDLERREYGLAPEAGYGGGRDLPTTTERRWEREVY